MSQRAAPATQNGMTTCFDTFEKERFCSFPRKHTARPQENQRLEIRHVGASKRAFRARLPPIFTICSLKMVVSYEFSYESINLLPQNRCFVRGFRQVSSHLTKGHPCHGICTLSALAAALTMRFAKNTQHDTSKVLRLPCKMKMDTSKVLRQLRKLQLILRKGRATQNDDTLQNTSDCHEVPRLPRETKQRHMWNLQKWPLLQNLPEARPYGPHADGCERLRTVADGWAPSSEHTLNSQTPRVKREPLL